MSELMTRLIGPEGAITSAAIVLGVTVVVSLAIRVVLRRLLRARKPLGNVIVAALAAPAQYLIWVVGVMLALGFTQLTASESLWKVLQTGRSILVIVIIAWFFLRLISHGCTALEAHSGTKRFDAGAVDAVSKLLRLVIVIIALLMLMQTLGVSIAGLLTFGGIGGIAIGFAAQDMLANFFGGLMIYLDKPFKRGEWIRSPDRELEGIVEEIGWRVTRIRNFDSRPLYVPNSAFSSVAIENVSRMTNRRIYETIGVRYDDATAVNGIVDDVRSYLQGHTGIDQDQTLVVSFTAFAPSSLDFFIFCYTKTCAGPEYHKVKQEVMLHILSIIEKHGAECAFPTTTLHLANASELYTQGSQPA